MDERWRYAKIAFNPRYFAFDVGFYEMEDIQTRKRGGLCHAYVALRYDEFLLNGLYITGFISAQQRASYSPYLEIVPLGLIMELRLSTAFIH